METDRVSVLGIPNARFLETDTEAMSNLGARMYEREEAYYVSTGREVPSVNNMLAISGGGNDPQRGLGIARQGGKPR